MISEKERAKRIIEQSEENERKHFFKVFCIIVAVILLAIFVWIRYDVDITSHINHTIDHALDIDVICADCSNTSEMCSQYWKAEHKCGF